MVWVRRVAGTVAGMVLLCGCGAAAAACQTSGPFDRWLDGFRREAATAGITQPTLAGALTGLTLDTGIIARDRRQAFFAQSFLAFSDKLATRGRVDSGRRKMAEHKALFARVEKTYGVAPAVITAFWALESGYGTDTGRLPVLRSLASLAYDCRRSELFRGELLEALRIIDRGDLRPSEMVGSWAGELGQTQFLPSHYVKHAIDFDGDGRRDLLRSVPDVLASTAALLKSLGWQSGEPWLQEVRVGTAVPWPEADLAIRHPRAQWAKWDVTGLDGRPLATGGPDVSLLLPMGRTGPAFLASPNFHVFIKWNQSLNYATTAAYLAARLDGAAVLLRGTGRIAVLTGEQLKELQLLLVRHGYLTGEADGKLGAATRAAVKRAQIKLGLPADSYPSPDLLERLRQR